jgi:single-stranded-DNA-specific exonuclease
VLVQRGLTDPEAAAAWLDPKLKSLGDPFALPDLDRAVERLLEAIERGERVTVFGDYDVDGLTSATLLAEVLEVAGLAPRLFLPLRLEEGYGLSVDALDRCIAETEPKLIVTVDCGTGSVDAVHRAAAAGIDVVVTDHHAVGETLAPAVAVVNPRRSPDERLHGLAGVGVAFKVAHGLLKKARERWPDAPWSGYDLKQALDLVALGTVADLVPLREENRTLVRHGLAALNRTRRAGLRALIQVAGIGAKVIDTYEVGYLLGPRLNAAGRLGTAQTALNLLRSRSEEEAAALARELDAANRARQEVERGIVDELVSRVDRRMEQGAVFGVVEADREWHPGVVGITASRIMHRHYRPSIVIGIDDLGKAKGSGRSIPGFNLVEALDACGDLLIKYGGHAMAAGLEIAWENIDAFRERFNAVAAERLAGHALEPSIALDGWLDGRAWGTETLDRMESLKPFGMGNPEPLWGCRGAAVAGEPRQVGKGHLKARFLCQGVTCDAIGFGLYERPLPPGPLDLAFHLRREEFRGRVSTVLHLKEFRATPA